MQGISVIDNLLKFFDEFESRVPYRIGLKDRGPSHSWHILETFIRRLPLKQAYSSFLLKELRSPKPLLFGKRVTSSGEVWVNIYLKAKKIQEERRGKGEGKGEGEEEEGEREGKEEEKGDEEGKSFEDAYVRAAVEEIQLVLFGRREAERFKLESNKEDPADRKVLARILDFSKPSKPVKSESETLLSLVEALKAIDEQELAEMRARFLEEEKARLRRSEPGNPDNKVEELARKAAEKRLKEFVRRREAEREGRLRDIIWRFEDQLLKHLPAERPLHGWVHWKVDLRSNCFHAIIPIRDGEGKRESTKCYALTIHWSDRESMNSKSRLEDHFHAAIRSFNRFLEKRFIREFRRMDLQERVIDHTVILVGNYPRKYQRRNRKGRLLPEMYTGSKLLALLSDAVGLCVEDGGSASKNGSSPTASGTGNRNGTGFGLNRNNLESLERLGRFVVVDDADLSDAFTGIMLYFRSRLERLKSELSKSGLCYGAVKLMHDRLLVCVDFFKTLSHCSWDSLRPVASLYSGHARKVKRFRRKLESYISVAVAVT